MGDKVKIFRIFCPVADFERGREFICSCDPLLCFFASLFTC